MERLRDYLALPFKISAQELKFIIYSLNESMSHLLLDNSLSLPPLSKCPHELLDLVVKELADVARTLSLLSLRLTGRRIIQSASNLSSLKYKKSLKFNVLNLQADTTSRGFPDSGARIIGIALKLSTRLLKKNEKPSKRFKNAEILIRLYFRPLG